MGWFSDNHVIWKEHLCNTVVCKHLHTFTVSKSSVNTLILLLKKLTFRDYGINPRFSAFLVCGIWNKTTTHTHTQTHANTIICQNSFKAHVFNITQSTRLIIIKAIFIGGEHWTEYLNTTFFNCSQIRPYAIPQNTQVADRRWWEWTCQPLF